MCEGLNYDPAVSIHALLAECDPYQRATPPHKSRFQSTHSLRSATLCTDSVSMRENVSIHALLAECDACASSHCNHATGFNPRTPCGVRPTIDDSDIVRLWFQSTHSLRSATAATAAARAEEAVSIHALLAECDHTN